CLELHSHKTQKRKFIEDIAARLEVRATAPSERTVRSKREHYQQVRNQIAEYIRAVTKTAPGYGGSHRDLFCEASWLHERMGTHSFGLDPSLLTVTPSVETAQLAAAACAQTKRARTSIRS